MKIDDQVVSYFNDVLKSELIAANQYFLHYRILKQWGFMRLSHIEYEESIDETRHAGYCISRILFLDGIIESPKIDKLNIGRNLEDILRIDLELECSNAQNLREGIMYADSVHDFGSKELMIKILIDEEKHIDFLETELSLIAQIGIHNYLQSQIGSSNIINSNTK